MVKDIEMLCDEIVARRAARDELKAELNKAGTELGELERSLVTRLRAGENDKVARAGFEFTASTRVAWAIAGGGREHLVPLLKEGAPELVKETVNASSLSAYLRKNENALEEQQPAWWGSAKDYIERRESEFLSVRKSPKKKP